MTASKFCSERTQLFIVFAAHAVCSTQGYLSTVTESGNEVKQTVYKWGANTHVRTNADLFGGVDESRT